MSIVEELRREYNILQALLNVCKLELSQLLEVRKEFNADPEFDATFALREAECNYFIAEAEANLEALNNEIERLEVRDRDN